ncbi:steryl-sulfatase-like isoform X1 [Glandiceps talaboti]
MCGWLALCRYQKQQNMTSMVGGAIFFLILLSAASTTTASNDGGKKPNFLILLVDDLGMGDVGCFGNDTIRTPNIDKLASEGVKLNHNMVPAPTCTPSRAAMLTGRYPVRMGLASKGRPTMFGCNACTAGMPTSEITYAEVLKTQGYSTAYLGKWHLGLHSGEKDYAFLPTNQGFDYFYGMPLTNMNECADPPNGRSSVLNIWILFYKQWATLTLILYSFVFILRFFGLIATRGTRVLFVLMTVLSVVFYNYPNTGQRFLCVLMENHEVVEQPIRLENMTVRFTKQATSFLQQNQDRPFLLVMAYLKVHTALFTSKQFKGVSRHNQYGDNVEEMDWSVGQIVDTLDKLGLKENTFVYFTSDHGGHLEEIAIEKGREGEREGGWNGIYKGGKSQVWEGGVRVPTVARYPPLIPKNSEISVPTSSMDLLPTVAKLANSELPKDRIIDGTDITGLLSGKYTAPPHGFLFIYCGPWIHGVTIRRGDTTYKVVFTTPKWTKGTQGCFDTWLCACHDQYVDQHDPPLVFDLTHDPGEHRPLESNDGKTIVLVEMAREAVDKHNNTIIPVEDQFQVKKRALFRPWLQPCCNFPFCSCKENDE